MPPFDIDAVTGQLTVSAAVLNFETTPVYNITVVAPDNGTPALAANATITIPLR